MRADAAVILKAMGYKEIDEFVLSQEAGGIELRWFSNRPRPTDADIDAAAPLAAAEAADLAAYESDKAALKAAIANAATRLTTIRDNASPSNAQVVAAVRDMAGYQLQVIKALRRML